MQSKLLTRLIACLFAASCLSSTSAFAAESSQALLKAKKDAEARGYTFIASHNEIVNKAKQEGKLRVLAEIEQPTIKAALKAFTNKYPFINLHIKVSPALMPRGKKLSTVSWERHQHMDQWQAKVFEAYGFPKAEIKR